MLLLLLLLLRGKHGRPGKDTNVLFCMCEMESHCRFLVKWHDLGGRCSVKAQTELCFCLPGFWGSLEECQKTSIKRSKRQLKSGSGGELLDEMEHLGWSLRALCFSGFELNPQERCGDRKEFYGGEWHGKRHAPWKGHSGCYVEEGRAASMRACFMTQLAEDKAGACEGWLPGKGRRMKPIYSAELYCTRR